MKLSWQFVRRNGMGMADAMRCAWANFKVKNAMRTKVVEFWYKKATTGEIRQAFGTTDPHRYEYTAVGGQDTKPADCVRYWDCVKQGWRMFKDYNLIKVCI